MKSEYSGCSLGFVLGLCLIGFLGFVFLSALAGVSLFFGF